MNLYIFIYKCLHLIYSINLPDETVGVGVTILSLKDGLMMDDGVLTLVST